eukprot:66670-Chlamydomonas_euryale.AAC.1
MPRAFQQANLDIVAEEEPADVAVAEAPANWKRTVPLEDGSGTHGSPNSALPNRASLRMMPKLPPAARTNAGDFVEDLDDVGSVMSPTRCHTNPSNSAVEKKARFSPMEELEDEAG